MKCLFLITLPLSASPPAWSQAPRPALVPMAVEDVLDDPIVDLPEVLRCIVHDPELAGAI